MYADNAQAAADSMFKGAVAAAAVKYAINTVATEPTTTANHTNREALGVKVCNGPDVWGSILAVGVAVSLGASLANLEQGQLTDAVVDGAIAAIWNAYAGVG